MNTLFWKDKRVLVTGHTGFKGSWLCLWLHVLGARTKGISLDPSSYPNLFEVAGIESVLEHQIVDIRNFELLRRHIQEFEPEIIFHLAAQPLVIAGYKDPLGTYTTNVVGTANLLESARLCNTTKAIINITTDKCYENLEWVWGYRESDSLGGKDPYSSSKACSELITHAYRHSYFVKRQVGLATARAGNVIGGGDWAQDRLVPDILRSLELRKRANIRNPKSIRPWQHVLEPLSGYLTLAELLFSNNEKYSESWNFGPEQSDQLSVGSIASLLCSRWGFELGWQSQEGNQPIEAAILRLDTSKAKQRLNWYPKWNIVQAIDKVVEWHRAWIDGSNMSNFCLRQINEYQASQ